VTTSNKARTAGDWLALAVVMAGRLIVNLQFRMIYPFLPAICRGLGVSLQTGSLLVTARSVVGLTSPWYGRLSDRYGRKALMLAGLLAIVVGAGLVAAWPTLGVALAAFVILGLARASFDPAAQAMISDMVPYAQRGRALGLIEMPWSASWLIGVPVAGWVIARAGWQAMFFLVAGLGAIGLLLTLRTPSSATDGRKSAEPLRPNKIATAAPIRFTWPLVALLVISALIGLASANFFIISGAWLESRFGLAVDALGLVFGITGIAELAAELLSAGILDRVGKMRGLLAGLGLNALAFILLPHLSGSLALALVGLSFLILTSEFSIVSVLSPLSELAPAVRGTVMALNSGLLSGGVLLASLIGPQLWTHGGLALVTAFSAAAICCAGLLLWRLPKSKVDAP
jgi:MFS transporter, DHA1 family, inner membrane transport protein